MTTTTLIAFHGDPAIKEKYLARVRAHRAADEIINGQYWEHGKGCAVGCTIHGSDHGAYEAELGIPQILAHLEDRLFERCYLADPAFAKEWPGRFLDSIKVGADLSMVWPKFAHWLLADPRYGVIQHAKRPEARDAIERVATLYARWIGGEKPGATEWSASAAAAAAYASSAAAAAAYASSAAADAATADAAYAAHAAARAAALTAANYAAWGLHYIHMADKLAELLTEAK